MKKATRSHGDKSKGKQILFSSLFGMGVGILCMIALIIAFSAVCMMLPDPHPFILPLCFFLLYASAFAAGFAGVKRNKGSDALLCGSLCGVMLMAILWLAFTLLDIPLGTDSVGALSFIPKLIMIPFSLAGAFLGLKGSEGGSKKARRKH